MFKKKEIVLEIESAFLKERRTIRIYLPKHYKDDKKYPVLYMHDGQNIVRKAAYSHKSWNVTKTLRKLKKDIIVVGIDCVNPRQRDYYAFDLETGKFNENARKYLNFVVKEVVPFIDENYATYADYEHRYLAGSSLGGCITTLMAMLYPGIFSVYGVFSPALRILKDGQYEALFKQHGTDLNGRYFVSAGLKENLQFLDKPSHLDLFINDMHYYTEELENAGAKVELSIVYPKGQHQEQFWAQQFIDFARLL